ncbi:helix-turn-helix domain-containing protein [Aestuariivivens insulae]|uniref:helix-turn-helix domain-containing protein n=1 Tax=Aestuariivivens insulae TaxID=1621988 RepID=UPI001F55C319|nr:helix-turn-helix transcriptional regulator [Aestuariivivens insulae]
MNVRQYIFVLFLISGYANAQYKFSGQIDKNKWHDNVYLSIIDDYRHLSGIYEEQIIDKVKADANGYFEFTGNMLEDNYRIYRIHVDNCTEDLPDNTHFNGHCDDSKAILFIAKRTDTLQFPFSFDHQMFCDVKSKNEKALSLIKIDSLIDEMKYAYSAFRSEANRTLNNKKWFKTLQDFGQSLNEPLAELYIYTYLSDRRNSLHQYYLEDLKTNPFYEDLLKKLTAAYPNATYTQQYRNELNSDEFILDRGVENKAFNWNYLLYGLLFVSIVANILLLVSFKKFKKRMSNNSKEQLTRQEQNILNLLLEDKSNKEIADALFVSLSTVKTHVNNIYRKLNVQNRNEAKSLFNK